MRKFLVLVVVALCVSSARGQNSGGASQASAKLEEANNLDAQVVELHKAGKFDEAMPLAKRAVELRRAELGAGHTLVADTLHNLAAVQMGAKKYDEAEESLKNALTIYEKETGKENPKLVPVLDRLALTAAERGKGGYAEDLLLRGLELRRKSSGENSREFVQGLVILGQVFQSLRKYDKAIPFYNRAIETAEKTKGIGESEIAEVVDLCSDVLSLVGRMDEALAYAQRASEVHDKLSGDPSSTEEQKKGLTLAGIATVRIEPVYPLQAKTSGISGSVAVQVIVSRTGRVIRVKAIFGPAQLREAAMKAAIGWRFSPTVFNGKPVKVIGTITFNFRL